LGHNAIKRVKSRETESRAKLRWKDVQKGWHYHPMTLATAQAAPNIAFMKYWANRDNTLRLPMNGSISMNLDGLYARDGQLSAVVTEDSPRS
jgi:mevalonate pyrophosphate decarboxylase